MQDLYKVKEVLAYLLNFELIFFSSIFATIVFLVGLFTTGEHHVLKAQLLGVLFFDSGKDDLDYYKGATIVSDLLSAVSYFYTLRKEKGTATRPPAS
ncbi:unnamed protein product [Eruca vesicaria subsp. sativa]|uniref:Uncharacterized protein n=1 Tax=Eruca vesicaria subsp. sativa TaxID=29727 RepID=A0ABC8LR44_ERUVS|nr:unnamed protein product [Eruca vesicaria subsp. sativa]